MTVENTRGEGRAASKPGPTLLDFISKFEHSSKVRAEGHLQRGEGLPGRLSSSLQGGGATKGSELKASPVYHGQRKPEARVFPPVQLRGRDKSRPITTAVTRMAEGWLETANQSQGKGVQRGKTGFS